MIYLSLFLIIQAVKKETSFNEAVDVNLYKGNFVELPSVSGKNEYVISTAKPNVTYLIGDNGSSDLIIFENLSNLNAYLVQYKLSKEEIRRDYVSVNPDSYNSINRINKLSKPLCLPTVVQFRVYPVLIRTLTLFQKTMFVHFVSNTTFRVDEGSINSILAYKSNDLYIWVDKKDFDFRDNKPFNGVVGKSEVDKLGNMWDSGSNIYHITQAIVGNEFGLNGVCYGGIDGDIRNHILIHNINKNTESAFVKGKYNSSNGYALDVNSQSNEKRCLKLIILWSILIIPILVL